MKLPIIHQIPCQNRQVEEYFENFKKIIIDYYL